MERASVGTMCIAGVNVYLARTGYTGEPVGFEIFIPDGEGALRLWDALVDLNATPVGLGARDTLRLEATLPLYGHEYGRDPVGAEMPALAFPKARYALDFSPEKGDFLGKASLMKQLEALRRIKRGDLGMRDVLPRLIRPATIIERGVARRGDEVLRGDLVAGQVTSGTAVPYWEWEKTGPTDRWSLRSICMAYVDCDIGTGERIKVNVRGRPLEAVIVDRHLDGRIPPYARPVLI